MVTKTLEKETRHFGATIPFEKITEPGTYFCNWSGHLVRIPEEAVRQGRSPIVEFLGKETIYATKLSDDPYVPITKARMLAADLDHSVNF